MKFRRYTFDINFFKKWTKDMAYVLGFTFSDGNIYGSALSYSISTKDIAVLKYIKNCLKAKNKIEIFKKQSHKKFHDVCRLRISSVELIKYLEKKFGLVPNKTSIAAINFKIPKQFYGDFVRGFFDGDGWIYQRRNTIESGICTASKQMIHDLHKLCNYIGVIRTRDVDSRKLAKIPLYIMDMRKSDSLKLRDLMYQNEPFCLLRKKKRFWNFYTPSERLWTDQQMKALKDNHNLEISELSKIIGKSEKAIQMKKFKLGLCPKKPKNWKWTKEEDETVKKGNNIDELAQLINRSKAAILIRRKKFGFNDNIIIPWTNNQVDFLIHNYSKPRKELARTLNKSEESIKTKLMWLRGKNLIPEAIKIGRPKRDLPIL